MERNEVQNYSAMDMCSYNHCIATKTKCKNTSVCFMKTENLAPLYIQQRNKGNEREEINNIENRKTIETVNRTKDGFFKRLMRGSCLGEDFTGVFTTAAFVRDNSEEQSAAPEQISNTMASREQWAEELCQHAGPSHTR